jgi:hypothetical protein
MIFIGWLMPGIERLVQPVVRKSDGDGGRWGNVSDSGALTDDEDDEMRQADDRATGVDGEQSRTVVSVLESSDEGRTRWPLQVVVVVVLAVVEDVATKQQAASRGVGVADRNTRHEFREREGQLSSLSMRNTIKAQGKSQ